MNYKKGVYEKAKNAAEQLFDKAAFYIQTPVPVSGAYGSEPGWTNQAQPIDGKISVLRRFAGETETRDVIVEGSRFYFVCPVGTILKDSYRIFRIDDGYVYDIVQVRSPVSGQPLVVSAFLAYRGS